VRRSQRDAAEADQLHPARRHAAAALLHQARVVVRRAERSVWALLAADGERTNPETARYLNRLSDLLFILARAANPGGDVLWEPGRTAGPRAAAANGSLSRADSTQDRKPVSRRAVHRQLRGPSLVWQVEDDDVRRAARGRRGRAPADLDLSSARRSRSCGRTEQGQRPVPEQHVAAVPGDAHRPARESTVAATW
jgi:hypothetical protein